MLNMEEQAQVILIIAQCTSIDEVIDYIELIYEYVQELTQNPYELEQMNFFLKKVSLNRIQQFIIEL